MSQPIQIVIEAQTEAAAAKVKQMTDSVVASQARIAQANQGITSAVAAAGAQAGQARMAYMIFGAQVQGVAAQLIAGANPIQALAVQIPALAQGFSYLGMNLMRVIPYFAILGAAAGGAYALWREATSAEREAAEAAEKHAQALKEIPALLKQISDLETARLIGPGTSGEARDILMRKKRLYRTPEGEITAQSSRSEVVNVQSQLGYGPVMQTTTQVMRRQFKELTEAEYNEHVRSLVTSNEALREGAYKSIVEIQRRLNTELGTEDEKRIAKIKENARKELAEIAEQRTLAQAGGNKLGGREEEFADAERKVRLIEQQEIRKVIYERMQNAREDELRAITEIEAEEKKARQEAEERERTLAGLARQRERELETIRQQEQIEAERSRFSAENTLSNPDASHSAQSQAAAALVSITDEQLKQNEAALQGNITEAERLRLLRERLQLEGQFANDVRRQAQVERQINDERLQGTITMFAHMAGAAKAFGREGFIAYKTFAIGEAVISGIKATLDAFEWGTKTGGPILGAVAAAAAGGFAATQIGAIASAGYARGGRPEPGAPALVGEEGPELWVPDSAGTILSHRDTMRAMRTGAGGIGAQAPSERNIKVHFWTDKAGVVQDLRNNPEFDALVVDVNQRTAHFVRGTA